MRSLRALRIISLGLAFAAALASGGLPVSSQSGQEKLADFIVTVSYPDNAVAFIDLLPDGSTRVTRVSVARGPIGVAVHLLRLFTYVVSWDANVLSIIDNRTRQVAQTISLGSRANPYSVAVRPDGAVAYVVNAGPKDVAVLDTSDAGNPRLLTRIPLLTAQAPRNIAFWFDGDRHLAFVSDSESGRIQILDSASHQRIGELDTGGSCASGVKVSNLYRWLYVADRCLSRVYAVEVQTITTSQPKVTAIPLAPTTGAWYIAFLSNDQFAYVSLTEPRDMISSGQIAIIDTEQQRQIGVIPVGGFPAGLEMIVKIPDFDDPDTWQNVLVIFNPGASVQQQPLDSSTGQPSGPTTTTRTGLQKNLSGQPSGSGTQLTTPSGSPCVATLVEVKGRVRTRLPGQRQWRNSERGEVRAGQRLEPGTRVTTGYKSFAKIIIKCENGTTVTVLLHPISDIEIDSLACRGGNDRDKQRIKIRNDRLRRKRGTS
jgi:YVTN family beta-propeller protein